MREPMQRGIIYKAPMVLAMLADIKTMTRRPVDPQPTGEPNSLEHWSRHLAEVCGDFNPDEVKLQKHSESLRGRIFPFTDGNKTYSPGCGYGIPGDLLWVRETWQHSNYPYGPVKPSCAIFYRADYFDDPLGADLELSGEGIRRKWQPSIHMPKWACRLWLQITDVRIERLQDITERDAVAEGVHWFPYVWRNTEYPLPNVAYKATADSKNIYSSARDAFRELWESIYGSNSWISNEWVWVISFKRIEIIEIGAAA